MADQNPAPGWYEDPKDSNCVRWWAGEKWTEATLPNPGAAVAGDGGDDANNTDQLDRQGADEKTSTGIASKEAGVEGASGSAAEQRPRRKFGEVLGPEGKKLPLVPVGVSAALLVVLIAATSCGSDQGVQPSDTDDKPALEQTALEVTSPADGQSVKSKTASFRGTATPGAVVTLTGETSLPSARVAADGSWAAKVRLVLGTNTIAIGATAQGKSAIRWGTVTITRKRSQAEVAALRKTREEARQKRAAAKAAARQKRAAAKALARQGAARANALESAESYLDSSSFSRSGLIEQLEYEGYSTADATYAVEAIAPNWNKEAAESAKSYLDGSSFSRSGLIEQLEYEGYSHQQAEYGVSRAGL